MAIKANELRIGNYIRSWGRRKQGAPAKITVPMLKTLSKIEPHMEYIAIQPLELTQEILEKTGFSLADSKESLWLINIDPQAKTYLTINQVTGSAALYDDLGSLHYTTIPKKCKYLHQLQNLYFALTGQELEVTL
jgi:hypothetical protein